MSVGVGAVKGSADISISDYNMSCELSGNNLTAVGVMSNEPEGYVFLMADSTFP